MLVQSRCSFVSLVSWQESSEEQFSNMKCHYFQNSRFHRKAEYKNLDLVQFPTRQFLVAVGRSYSRVGFQSRNVTSFKVQGSVKGQHRRRKRRSWMMMPVMEEEGDGLPPVVLFL